MNLIGDVPSLFRHLFFSVEGFEAIFLFVLQQADSFNVAFNVLLLLVSLANFIIVRSDASDVVKHLPALLRRHFRQTRHVALKDDVVSVGACIGGPKETMKRLL